MSSRCFLKDTGARVIASVRGCEIVYRALSLFDRGINRRREERVMRDKIQWGVAFASNGLIYASDLHDAVMTALDLIAGMLL